MLEFLHVNVAVGIQNALWAGFGWSVVALFGAYLWRTRGEGLTTAKELAWGIALVSGASALHRTYWWFWRLAKSHGDKTSADWFVYNADWLWLCVISILIGYGFHLRSRLRTLFGQLWWVPVSAWALFLVWITLFTYGDM